MIAQLLTTEDSHLWQKVEAYLDQNDFEVAFRNQIAQVAVASSYALNQLCRTPELLDLLHQSTEFKLDDFPDIIDTNLSADLTEVKQTLRQYRHRKLIQIIISTWLSSHLLIWF
ncbi:MAG: hypothetical protein OEY09_15675 [Gammaproteobacteria bacterium]|nr:hypothetical protein [Gammaproteobacteria bacterium]